MSAVPARLRHESGQAIVFVIAIMTVLIGIGALVIDGGSWFRTQRHLQTAADAAALAGAQDLPNTGVAQASAIDYAQQELHECALTDGDLPRHITVRRQLLRRRRRADDGPGHPREDLRRRLQQRHRDGRTRVRASSSRA